MNLPFHINLAGTKRGTLAPNASRDWLLLLGLVIVLLAASAGINSALYHQAVVGVQLSPNSRAPAVNADLVAKVENVFSTRQAEETKYQSGAYSFADPSK